MEVTNNAENASGTPIQEFYRDKSIFITGATGFLGKVLVEKLLYSCANLNSIYVLIRSKRNKDCEQRFKEFLEDEAFSRLDQKVRLKICAIPGDISQPGLGLSKENRKLLVENIDVVFHVAATVRFDEPLPVAVAINVVGTKELLDMARVMKNLQAYVHVSTAYSNCHLQEIGEKIYEAPIQYNKIIPLINFMEKTAIDRITPLLLDRWPNTYVYTKSIAEDIVKTESKGIPVSVFRPAIIVGSYKEPVPGWIDNLYGATGVIVGCGSGILRTLNCDKSATANVVPADMTVNAMIAAAWNTANGANEDTNRIEPSLMKEEEGPTVYNYVSSVEKPLQWSELMGLATAHGDEVPTTQAIWCTGLSLHGSRITHRIAVLLFHYLPALLIDAVGFLFGKQTNMLKIHKKIDKFSDVLAYFTTRNWTFKNENVQNLWQCLSSRDKMMFPFDMASVDWDCYFYNYIRGVRKFIFKEDLSTVPQAKKRMKRFRIIHAICKFLIVFLIFKLFWGISSIFLS